MEHRDRDCSRRPDLVSITAQTSASNSVRPLKEVQQPFKGRFTGKGSGNGAGRGQRALGRGTGQAEVRQPTLVYLTRHREERDDVDVITCTFISHSVLYYALIDTGSIYSYITSIISVTLV